MQKEDKDNVQVIFNQIELYQDESLAEDDSSSEGNEVDEEGDGDGDGLTAIIQEGINKRDIPFNLWFL